MHMTFLYTHGIFHAHMGFPYGYMHIEGPYAYGPSICIYTYDKEHGKEQIYTHPKLFTKFYYHVTV